MCTVSMIGDVYARQWPQYQPTPQIITLPPEVTRAEFDALKREVETMKALLQAAKQYDVEHGEPDCEMDEKLEVLRRVADLVGIDLDDVLGARNTA